MTKFYVTDGNLELLTTQPTPKQAAKVFCEHFAGRGLLIGAYIGVDKQRFDNTAGCDHLYRSLPVISTLKSCV